MNTINQDQKRLDNIAKAYWSTSGEIKEMWKKKWYELVKIISKKQKGTITNEYACKRLATVSWQIYRR